MKATLDTTVVIDALDRSRTAAVVLFERARAGELDVAFSTRLERELTKAYTMADVERLVGSAPRILGTTARWDLSTWDGGDVYATEGSVSTGGPASGRYGMIDSDHLEAHRLAQRDIFVTSDADLLKEARARGFEAVTPEQLIGRLEREFGGPHSGSTG